MPTLALLGDSILDNRAYTKPSPDTATHLRESLGAAWAVELLAQDGATISDIQLQLRSLPAGTEYAVLSAGSNDAVEHIGLLTQPATSAAEVLSALDAIAGPFSEQYERLLGGLRPRVDRLLLCTIYEPPLSNPAAACLATVPLTILNDRIIRAAVRFRADVIDLRTVCTVPSDFVLEIEPSAIGAAKIAQAVHQAVQPADGLPAARLFAT